MVWLDEVEPGRAPWGGVAAIGNFDGVHVGHQALLARAMELARELGVGAFALTFEPHPDMVLRPQVLPGLLTPLDEKVRWLGRYGVGEVVVARFDRTFASLPAQDFLDGVLGQRLGVRGVVVGDDFTFGHQARGRVLLLQAWAERRGLAAQVIQAVGRDGQRVSSSRIRHALREGAFDEVLAMLGHPYGLAGRVVPGHGRGRVLGYPTANLELEPYQLRPPEGVYLAEAEVLDGEVGQSWPALAVYSHRPTFGPDEAAFEVFLLDFQGDLYAKRLRVLLVRRVRGIIRFPSPAELQAQIEQDFREARRYFGL